MSFTLPLLSDQVRRILCSTCSTVRVGIKRPGRVAVDPCGEFNKQLKMQDTGNHGCLPCLVCMRYFETHIDDDDDSKGMVDGSLGGALVNLQV